MDRLLLVILLLGSFSVRSEEIRFCSDEAEWPPYTYYERDKDVINKKVVLGASVDLLQKIKENDPQFNYSISLLPWARCLSEVDNFTVDHEFEVVSDASFNQERAEKYYFSDPVYSTHLGVFYNKDRFPEPKIVNTKDLNPYSLCANAAYNLDMYFAAGLKHEVEGKYRAPNVILKNVELNRCEFYLTSLEIIYGGAMLGQYTIPPNLQSVPLQDQDKTLFYFLISKKSPRAKNIVDQINQGIKTLQSKGEYEKIFLKYLPRGSGL